MEEKRNANNKRYTCASVYTKGKIRKLDFELDLQIKGIKQKKLTNYQKKLLHKIETEANEFDRKGNE